jgi:hypothetical protein
MKAAAALLTASNNARPMEVQQLGHTPSAHMAKRLVLIYSEHTAKYGC